DLIFTGSLHNSGEKLQLKDVQSRVLDEVDASKKWFAGKTDNDKESMERIDPLASGNLAENWQSTGLPVRRGHDAKNNFISGTPKKYNSSFNYLNGSTGADKTLAAQFSPYFLGDFTVATGTTLTIPAGIIIKSGKPANGGGNLFVYGNLITQGAVESPVIFTSYRDTNVGGNTNPWDNSTMPAPGDWNRLQFYPGSSVVLANTQILYGNYRSKITDPDGALLADGAVLNAIGLTVKWTRLTDTAINLINSSGTFSNCVIAQNYKGLAASAGLLAVSDCLFENNGLQAMHSAGADVSLKNNTFKNNGWDNGKLEWWKQSSYGPVAVRDAVPKLEGNNFIGNVVNAIDWGGAISASGTLEIKNDWPLVSNGFTVTAGATLQIKSGVIFKMKPGANIIVNGAIEALGLSDKKIIFTSWRDDSDGFDSNGDSTSSTPNQNGLEWGQMRFETGATSTLDNVIVHYANQSPKLGNPEGSIYINNTPIFIDNLLLEYSALPGVAMHLKNASQVEIKNSVIKNYAKNTLNYPSIGLKIDAGAPKISNSTVQTFNVGMQAVNNADLSGVDVNFVDVF
ncbi:MAG TPA: hypothetical protein DEB73_00650, partial [Candidatus Magasanikbacteria bacterium]|nr:hypothetical protein [Candidatus Magasanikbacteria bacterium]